VSSTIQKRRDRFSVDFTHMRVKQEMIFRIRGRHAGWNIPKQTNKPVDDRQGDDRQGDDRPWDG